MNFCAAQRRRAPRRIYLRAARHVGLCAYIGGLLPPILTTTSSQFTLFFLSLELGRLGSRKGVISGMFLITFYMPSFERGETFNARKKDFCCRI